MTRCIIPAKETTHDGAHRKIRFHQSLPHYELISTVQFAEEEIGGYMHITWGHYNRFKNLSTVQGSRCCVCEQYSECTIERWRSWFYLQMIPIWIAAKGYLFTWNGCGHSMGLEDPSVVKRYKEEQVDTGLFGVPPCRELKLLSIERPMPFNLKNILLLSPFILIIAVALIFICLEIAAGIR